MTANVGFFRKRAGFTQEELSSQVGISRRALSSIEKSIAVPSVDLALKLAAALRTTVEQLFTSETPPAALRTTVEQLFTAETPPAAREQGLPPRITEDPSPSARDPGIPPRITEDPSPAAPDPGIPPRNEEDAPHQNRADFTFIDLFAGIGGIRLGFERAGGKCVFSSEFDEDARKTYEANFGERPAGDITKINAAEIPDFDVLLGGFPCQAFSIIGKKEGFANETCGTLFFEIERILKEKRPAAFLLENVKNLVAHDHGNTFKVILEHLEALGYRVHAKVLNALDYGVPQKRERIMIVGFIRDLPFAFPPPAPENERLRLSDLLEENPDAKYYVKDGIRRSRLERLREKDYPKPYISHENMAGAVTPHPYASALRAGASANYILINDERRPTEREMLRLQGFPDTFRIVVPYGKVKKQCGNSVAVPVIEAVAKQMLKTLRASDRNSPEFPNGFDPAGV